MICFISSSKPISRILSASSMTNAFRFLKMNPLVFCIVSDEMQADRGDWRTHLEMIQKTTGCGNDQVDSLGQLVGLCLPVCSAHQHTERLRVTLHELFGDAEDLQSQFSSGRNDDDSSTCPN